MKYPSQPLYDTGIPGPGPSNFLEPVSHPHTISHTGSHTGTHTQHHNSHTVPDKDLAGGENKAGPQPKATHYLASNCVLLTYFQGEAASLVDDHFTRSLGQPSSFTLDKPAPANKPYVRSASFTYRLRFRFGLLNRKISALGGILQPPRQHGPGSTCQCFVCPSGVVRFSDGEQTWVMTADLNSNACCFTRHRLSRPRRVNVDVS
ncbi:hypothetical protein EGW08_017134 [Elysia chlorotica]|uniref:Transcription cofactor vestigial-like protein 2 n=1 Tax=Elysia chlorotica TaxID=188477 RepID=A0A433T0M4_ELYCH|nr:hypothetical protein EGW08_017134 [Elysia chlorotica]